MHVNFLKVTVAREQYVGILQLYAPKVTPELKLSQVLYFSNTRVVENLV